MSCRPPVLFFLPDLDGGGAQRTIVNLVNALARQGAVRPVLAAGRAGGPARSWLDDDRGLADLGARRTLTALAPLRRLIAEVRPAILVSTMVDANTLAALAAATARHKPALVVRETNSHRARGDLSALRRRAAGWAYARADRVIALSHGVAGELIADYRLAPDRVRTIHNPVDVARFAERAAAARRRPPPLAKAGPLIVAAGRLTRQKGFDILIDCLARLDDRTAQLAILGEGPERAALEAEAAHLGVADRVTLAGFVEDPAAWLAHADIFALSSRFEGFGHVIVEAMACGAPVVAFDCPHGPRDIIADHTTGRLVPAGDDAGLVAAIDELLAKPALRRALAKEASAAAGRFASDAIARQYLALFAELPAGIAVRS